nr:glutathione peroxidase [Campylobacter suis]
MIKTIKWSKKMEIYDFKVRSINGADKYLSDYKGKVLLIVNTASLCGFTPQYDELQMLYSKFKDKGLCILGFPCNQFMDQEPDSDAEILDKCELNFGIKFDMFARCDVRGENAIPLFKHLTSKQPFKGLDPNHPLTSAVVELIEQYYPELLKPGNNEVKWNFTKFIVDQNGDVVARFEPTAPMKEIVSFVEKLLKN